jgi:V-type H+-transporting ATPase subunit a
MHDSAIYQRLDYMHQSNNLFIGYFWSCKTHKEIDYLLSENNVNISEAQFEDGHIGNIPAPTYFKLNEFTSPFQEVVTTYGVPSYKEINPAYFTIVTFPFLFGVMFGDVGHGSFLLILAMIICFWDSSFKNNEQLKILADLRYMILLMGIFSTF